MRYLLKIMREGSCVSGDVVSWHELSDDGVLTYYSGHQRNTRKMREGESLDAVPLPNVSVRSSTPQESSSWPM